MTSARRFGLVAVLLALGAGTAAAQRRPAVDRCRLQIINVDRLGVRTTPTPGSENYFAGGNVHAQCIGRNVHIYADSVAMYSGGTIAQFISQGSKVRFRDSSTAVDTDFGTYFRDGERFEAQGRVLHRDLKTGSTITGPRVDYFRPVRGLRTELEVIAYNRPTIRYEVTDSAGRPEEPYVIVGNRVRTVGSDVIYASGNVTIDRENLKGAGDSLWLDAGSRQAGQLIGHASLQTRPEGATGPAAADEGFTISGKVIDIGLKDRELSSLRARDSADLINKDVTLEADSIGLSLVNRQVEMTRAWGRTVRPKVVSADYQILGDSLQIETPNQQLSEVRAYGNGWAGFVVDTTRSPSGRRDFVSGQLVTASFIERDSAGVKKTAIKELEAVDDARAYYQLDPEAGQTKGSINYTRAKRILVTMRVTADSNTVQRVDAVGAVDGIHLQPALVRRRDSVPDSLRVLPDSLPAARRDSVPAPRDTTSRSERSR